MPIAGRRRGCVFIILVLILILGAVSGCVTRSGKLEDGRQYQEYEIIFNPDTARFYVPLE
jgi:hypothetical protein